MNKFYNKALNGPAGSLSQESVPGYLPISCRKPLKSPSVYWTMLSAEVLFGRKIQLTLNLILSDLVPGYGWWLPDDSGKFPEQNNYSVLEAGLASIDNKVEAALWVQGDTDAGSGRSTDYYKKDLLNYIASFEQTPKPLTC